MKLRKAIDKSTLTAVTTLLSSSFPEITSETLLDALVSYGKERKNMETHRPLTRKEASEMLKVSLPTINRLLNEGKLKRVKLSDSRNGAVRIEYSSIERLLD